MSATLEDFQDEHPDAFLMIESFIGADSPDPLGGLTELMQQTEPGTLSDNGGPHVPIRTI
jgi:hypothetical protein